MVRRVPLRRVRHLQPMERPELCRLGVQAGGVLGRHERNTIIDDLLSIPDEDTYGNMMTLGSGGSI